MTAGMIMNGLDFLATWSVPHNVIGFVPVPQVSLWLQINKNHAESMQLRKNPPRALCIALLRCVTHRVH
jgi:hypothetical protein